MRESSGGAPPADGGCRGSGAAPRELLGALGLGLLIAALFLWGNPVISRRHLAALWSDPDIGWQAYPAKALLTRAVGEGRLPLENRHIFGGMPFAGNPQAQLFYPPSALFLGDAARIPQAFAFSAWLHFGLCFAGAYLLANHVLAGLPARRDGALYAAAVTAFAGPMSTQVQQIAIFHTSAWIPLFLYGLLSGRLLAAAVGTGGMLLAGHTQIASYALVVGLPALALESRRRWAAGEPVLRPAARSLAGLAWGAALASVMLVPAIELLALSMRGRGVTEAFASVMAFEGWHFPLVYDPAAFANLKGDAYWTYPYVGAGTLALAVAGILMAGAPGRAARIAAAGVALLIAGRPALSALINLTSPIPAVGAFYFAHWDWILLLGKGWPITAAVIPLLALGATAALWPSRPATWAILALAALTLTLGPAAPVVGGLFDLPILSQGRGTVRFFHLYAPAVALLAAFPLAARPRTTGSSRRGWLLAALPLPLLALLAVAPWEERWPKAPFVLGLATLLAWLLATRGGVPAPARFVPHAIVLLELFTFGTEARRLTNPALYRYVDVDELLPGRDRAGRILTLGSRDAPMVFNAGMVQDHDAVLGYEPLALRTATELVAIGGPMALYDAPEGRLADLRDMQDVAAPSFLSARTLPMLSLMRCRYVVARGRDLRSDRRPLRADVEGTPPAHRVLATGGRSLDCFMLRVPSKVTYLLPATGHPLEIAWEVAVDRDPDAAGEFAAAGYGGTRVTARLEAGGRTLATDVVEMPPASDPASASVAERRLSVPSPGPAGGELRLSLEAQPRAPGEVGLVWIGTTPPRVEALDVEGARLLSERLRPITSPGTGEGLHAYELLGALPPAVAPRRVSHEEPLEALARPGFDPAEVLLVRGEGAPAEGSLPPARVLTADDGARQLTVAFEAEGPTWLLLTRAFMPGLVAEVDGQQVEVRPADHHVCAVGVPAGRHVLALRYAPFSYRLALFGSAIAFAALLGAATRRPLKTSFSTAPPVNAVAATAALGEKSRFATFSPDC